MESKEQETRRLIRLVRQGETSARERLIAMHWGLVAHFVKAFYRPGMFVEYEDLMQQGCLGLLKAIEKFDLERRSGGKSIAFSTYASFWIRHYARREIQMRGSTVAVPVSQLQKPGRGNTCVVALETWTEEGFVVRPSLVDHPNLAYGDAAVATPDAFDALHAALETLPQRDRYIVERHYGFGEEGVTLAELSGVMKLSAQRLGQIKARALRTLRKALTAAPPQDVPSTTRKQSAFWSLEFGRERSSAPSFSGSPAPLR
jgi:RNA polymerase sigma factor (sigma-70 family)